MFDIAARLRRRMLAAIAIGALAAGGCGSDDSNNSADTSGSGDATVVDDTGSGDAGTGTDTGGAKDVATPLDTGTPQDAAGPQDVAGPQDAAPTGDTGSTADSGGGKDGGGAPDTGSDDGGSAPDSGVDSGAEDVPGHEPPVCKNGKLAAKTCYNKKQLLTFASGNYPMGPPLPDNQTKYPMPPNGCPPPDKVVDGCCNSAAGGGFIEKDTCCYFFCVGACCGRPLSVDGERRQADATRRDDWLRADGGDLVAGALDPTTRRALADTWLEDAAAEHASVASFARFTLDLLAFGAPAGLVADACAAAGDEVRHAQQCYSVAAALSGAARGPGALSVEGISASASLAEAAAAAVTEGCVGETIAALVAQTAARNASETAVAETLEAIAEDEARHAELAWRFVAWAIAEAPSARGRVKRAFVEALQSELAVPGTPEGVDAEQWRAWGRLTDEEWRRTAQRALSGVIAPCARQLLGEDAAATCAAATVAAAG